MLIEKAKNVRTLVQFVPYVGMVNPEHVHHNTYVPLATSNDVTGVPVPDAESVFIEGFLRKSDEFRQHEHIDDIPVEIRLGTLYVIRNCLSSCNRFSSLRRKSGLTVRSCSASG